MLDAGQKRGSHEMVQKAREYKSDPRRLPVFRHSAPRFFWPCTGFYQNSRVQLPQRNGPMVSQYFHDFVAGVSVGNLKSAEEPRTNAPTRDGDQIHSTDGVHVCGKTGFSL